MVILLASFHQEQNHYIMDWKIKSKEVQAQPILQSKPLRLKKIEKVRFL